MCIRDRYIIASGHYDAYWEGFQDNASSVGSVLTIAKAMIDSEYEPDKTFIFMVNGAEEFGTKDTRYDFCAGANAIIQKHPEWVKNTILFNNYELSAISDTEHLELNISSCFVKIMESLLRKLGYNEKFSYILPKGCLLYTSGGVQDASGMSVVFALAQHFAAMSKEERKTSMMFISTDSHYTDYEGHDKFLDMMEAAKKNIVLDCCVEHIAKEMDMDKNNHMIIYDRPETRILYVTDRDGLAEMAFDTFCRRHMAHTMLMPVAPYGSED